MPSTGRNELIQAKNVLLRRKASTADAAERATIDIALGELNDAIETIDTVSLLQAAGLVASATDALERVVASARMGPFDSFLADVQQAMASLHGKLDEMQSAGRLPAAPLAAVATGSAPAPAPAPAQAPAQANVAVAAAASNESLQLINSTRYEDLRDEYIALFDRCHLRAQFAENAEFYVSRLIKFKPIYQQLGSSTGIPWVLIGIIHGMECGFNFLTHLHNGDPLTARTVHVPDGHPQAGQAPFTWLESARDALVLEKLDKVTDWNLPRMLYQLEAYNGFGYRPRRMPTPYLWSFSNLYRSGKFVGDGMFDAQAVSQQCGAAVMLRVLQERGQV